MKAIAKYLPVEDNLKQGDICEINSSERKGLFKVVDIINTKKQILATILPLVKVERAETSKFRIQQLIKVKLFAVTQDIEVENRFVKYSLDFTKGLDTESFNELKEQGYYKILGEISSDATWVKEGDEIEYIYETTDGWIPTYSDPDNIGLAPSAEPTGIIKVKCPTCNTYY